MTKSLYAILNVAPDADPAVVEAAYKALMKKHHPDHRMDDPEGARRTAAEINEAFHILKDPVKRAEYDAAERVRRETIRRNALAEVSRPYQPLPMPLPPRRRRSKWPALFMIAAASLAVLFIWRGSDAALGGGSDFPPLIIGRAENSGKLAPVDGADVDRAVVEFGRIKERSGLIGLSAFSRDCFAAQSRSERASDFDFCVAFDKAASTYGIDFPSRNYLPQLPRFEPREINRRHAAAGKQLSNDDDLIRGRIAQVDILTSQRLDALNPQPAAAEEAPKAAKAAGAATYRQPRATPRRYGQRARQRSERQPARRDPDFLEREGYIY